LKTLVNQLEQGETPGDQIQGTGHSVYKVRLPNTDAQRGKSGGYRVIYYLKTSSKV
jgi:mRNA-degrading endonuclease RelE of RelBE toxin-antitoxin system